MGRQFHGQAYRLAHLGQTAANSAEGEGGGVRPTTTCKELARPVRPARPGPRPGRVERRASFLGLGGVFAVERRGECGEQQGGPHTLEASSCGAHPAQSLSAADGALPAGPMRRKRAGTIKRHERRGGSYRGRGKRQREAPSRGTLCAVQPVSSSWRALLLSSGILCLNSGVFSLDLPAFLALVDASP